MAQDKKFYIAFVLIMMIAVVNYGYRNFYVNQNRRVINDNFVLANKNYDLVVVGGSNALWGLDTSKYITKKTDIPNLAIPSGGFVFRYYADHLKELNIKSLAVIYSSYDILQLYEGASLDDVGFDIYGAQINRHFFASHRLINVISKSIKRLFKSYQLLPNYYHADNLGNLHHFNCNQRKVIDPVAPRPFDELKAKEFFGRIQILKSVLGSSDVLLRFPPIYIKEDTLRDWESYLASLKNFCVKNNIPLYVSKKTFYSDQSSFCNYAHHPNEALQQKLSEELFVDQLHYKLR